MIDFIKQFCSSKKKKKMLLFIVIFIVVMSLLIPDNSDTIVDKRLNQLYTKYNLTPEDFRTNMSDYNNSDHLTRSKVLTVTMYQNMTNHSVDFENHQKTKFTVVGENKPRNGISFATNNKYINIGSGFNNNSIKGISVIDSKPILLNLNVVKILKPHLPIKLNPSETVKVEDTSNNETETNKTNEKKVNVKLSSATNTNDKIPTERRKITTDKPQDNEKNNIKIVNTNKSKLNQIKQQPTTPASEKKRKPSFEDLLKKEEDIEPIRRYATTEQMKQKRKPSFEDLLKKEENIQPTQIYATTEQIKQNNDVDVVTDKQGRRIVRELYDLAPEVFNIVPRDFEDTVTNPCWIDDNENIKCLPYFYVIGMPDSGSENLWNKINAHPVVVETTMAGVNWWNRGRARDKDKMLASFQNYLKRGESLVSQLTDGKRNFVYGEHSTALFWDNLWWTDYFPNMIDGGKYTNADIISVVQPKVKLIVILTQPDVMVYNNYLIAAREKASPEDFDEKVENTIDRYENCTNQRSPRTCAYENNQIKGQTMRLNWGIFSQYFKDWLKVFPIEQFKIMEKGNFESNCLTVLPEIYHFLNLDRLTMKKIRTICKSPGDISRKVPPGSLPMLTDTKQLLDAFYEPFLDELDDVLIQK